MGVELGGGCDCSKEIVVVVAWEPETGTLQAVLKPLEVEYISYMKSVPVSEDLLPAGISSPNSKFPLHFMNSYHNLDVVAN